MSTVDNAKFPPGEWIGYSLDLTTLSSPQMDEVQAAVIRNIRLIDLDNSTTTEVPVNGTKYQVPNNIDLETTVENAQTSLVTYPTGSDAAQNLQADSTLAETLLPLSSVLSTTRWIRDLFVEDHQYALFGHTRGQYLAQLGDFIEQVNEGAIKTKVAALPPFDSNIKESVSKWRELFRTMGSHIITGTTYGARFQLMVSAANSKQPFTSHFPDDVTAAYHGLLTAGKYDPKLLGQRQFKKFLNERQQEVNCVGGDSDLAEQLVSKLDDPHIYDKFQSWSQSTDKTSTVISFALMSIWDVMTSSMDSDVSGRAVDVQKAFQWILEHPQEHWTKGSFKVTSDWGEIILRTPGSFFIRPENSPVLPGDLNVQFESTKIFFGKEHSGGLPPHPTVTIDFIIRNDGSPVDIGMCHGSDGTLPLNGSCEVIICDKSYKNDGKGDEMVYFEKCPVDPLVHDET
ncbi:hypothetical protein QCA50_007643 [Cerrena zonata]|uniref:MACPF domain-containing protein n=1 Tax=Cerrena zonata TaxID=2478898 RepID=A0AAW0GBL5_9APHY